MPEATAAAQWFRAKIEFLDEEIASPADLSQYAARFQKQVVLQVRGQLPPEWEATIVYKGHPEEGCFLDTAWIFVSSTTEAIVIAETLSGGMLRDAVVRAAHNTSRENIKSLDVRASDPLDPDEAHGIEAPATRVSTHFEENPTPKVEVVRPGVTPPQSRERHRFGWIAWALLVALFSAGFLRAEMRASNNVKALHDGHRRIEAQLAEVSGPAVLNCPPPPEVRLSCPPPAPPSRERRVRRYCAGRDC